MGHRSKFTVMGGNKIHRGKWKHSRGAATADGGGLGCAINSFMWNTNLNTNISRVRFLGATSSESISGIL